MIKKFSVINLFGYKTVSLKFENPYKILIGENGMGKTSILNCLYYTLSRDFKNLLRYKFDSIEILFEQSSLSFSYDEVYSFEESKKIDSNRAMLRTMESLLSTSDYNNLRKIVFSKDDIFKKQSDVKIYMEGKGLKLKSSDSYLFENIKQIVFPYVAMLFSKKLESLDFLSDYTILYYPTYRRVESPVDRLFSDMSSRFEDDPFVDEREIIDSLQSDFFRFGMDDVKAQIRSITQDLSEKTRTGVDSILSNTLSFLSSGRSYKQRQRTLNNTKIDVLLARQGKKLPDDVKARIKEYYESGEKNKPVLDYLIDMLFSLYEQNASLDDALNLFCTICNSYLYEKSFYYDEASMDVRLIHSKQLSPLNLDCLSSGEKQIVSIFSKICLGVGKKYIILFDEPEISLSIGWQEKLLPDVVKCGNCSFLLSVTHSPFIFNNEFKDYTEALSDSIVL